MKLSHWQKHEQKLGKVLLKKYILALLCSKSQAEVSEPEAYDSVRCGARLCVVSCMYCSILYVVDFL